MREAGRGLCVALAVGAGVAAMATEGAGLALAAVAAFEVTTMIPAPSNAALPMRAELILNARRGEVIVLLYLEYGANTVSHAQGTKASRSIAAISEWLTKSARTLVLCVDNAAFVPSPGFLLCHP